MHDVSHGLNIMTLRTKRPHDGKITTLVGEEMHDSPVSRLKEYCFLMGDCIRRIRQCGVDVFLVEMGISVDKIRQRCTFSEFPNQ